MGRLCKIKMGNDVIVGLAGAASIGLMVWAINLLGLEFDVINLYGPMILIILYLLVEGEEGARRFGGLVWSVAILLVTCAIIGLHYFF